MQSIRVVWCQLEYLPIDGLCLGQSPGLEGIGNRRIKRVRRRRLNGRGPLATLLAPYSAAGHIAHSEQSD